MANTILMLHFLPRYFIHNLFMGKAFNFLNSQHFNINVLILK